MLTPQEQETPGTALGSPRPSCDMSPYEEPGYRSSSYAVRGISSLFTVPHWLTPLEGICFELIFVRNLPKLSVGELHLHLLQRGWFARKGTFPLSGSLRTVETGLPLVGRARKVFRGQAKSLTERVCEGPS